MGAIGALREITGCDLGDAKGTVQHVTTVPGKCHSCGGKIGLRSLLDCPRCQALNLQPGVVDPAFPCPACGFVVLPDGYGSYEICPLCGWEDDGVQLANPTSGGGANRESLAEAQKRALRLFSLDLREQGEWVRSPSWRPLLETEIYEAERKRREKHWHTRGVRSPEEAYFAAAARDRNEPF